MDAIPQAKSTAGAFVVAPLGPFNCDKTVMIGRTFPDLLNVKPNNKSFQTKENWNRNNAEMGALAIGI